MARKLLENAIVGLALLAKLDLSLAQLSPSLLMFIIQIGKTGTKMIFIE